MDTPVLRAAAIAVADFVLKVIVYPVLEVLLCSMT